MPESIMIVEDEGVVALELQECLAQMGYTVPAVVATGEEAVAKALEVVPDLVLMDIRLRGGMDGIEAGRRIMDAQRIPVVYLTAYFDDATVERAGETAPFGYLLKPWEEKSLQIAIDMALHKAGHETEMRDQRDWYFSVLRNIGAPMIVCDPEGKIKFVNASAEQLLAVESRDGPRPLHEILELRDRPGTPPLDISALKALGEAGGARTVSLLVGRHGADLRMNITITPIRAGNSAPLGFVLFLRPPTSLDVNLDHDRLAVASLQEHLQTELIRLLILQEQGRETSDRFLEGQLDAYRSLIRHIWGAGAAVAGESDWRRSLVRHAVRDAHEETKRVLLEHADIARTGQIPRAKLQRYLEVMVHRLVSCAEADASVVEPDVVVVPERIQLSTAIHTALMVNEVVQQALSHGVRVLFEVRLLAEEPCSLRLVVRHNAPDCTSKLKTTPVLDTVVSEVRGSLSIQDGTDTSWTIVYPCG